MSIGFVNFFLQTLYLLVSVFALVCVASKLLVSCPTSTQDFSFNFSISKGGVFLDEVIVSADETIANFCGHSAVALFGVVAIFRTKLLVSLGLCDGIIESKHDVEKLHALDAIYHAGTAEVKTGVVSAHAGDIVCDQPLGKDFLCFGFGVADDNRGIFQQIAVVFLFLLAVESTFHVKVCQYHDVNGVLDFSTGQRSCAR